MKWPAMLRVSAAMVAADPVLAGIYGAAIKASAPTNHVIPLLEYQLVADSYAEQWAPMIIQWNQWCLTMDDLVASETRLRLLFHVELPSDFGGIMAWSEYEDANPLTVPDRDNVYGRAIRFRVTPLRAMYDPPPPP